MAISINQLFSSLNLKVQGRCNWGSKFPANFRGVYVIALTDNPDSIDNNNFDFEVSTSAFDEWRNNAPDIEVNDKKIKSKDEIESYLKSFWKPKENILYIGQSSSDKKSVYERVKQYYNHKLGNKGPHTGGYWLKLLTCLNNTSIYYVETGTPRDMEFKLLMKFIELSSGKSFYELESIGDYLPFANLTADFDKSHSIKNATKK